MGFYGDWVVPRIIDLALGMKPISEERKKCLSQVAGDVLEVGFGSGLNLPWYPSAVAKLVAVDPSTHAAKLASKRIAAARFPVEYVAIEGEKIAAPDASFDSVVCTFTLCTIPDPVAALEQIRRVLKPNGKFFFIEHGRASESGVQRWQDRMNGCQNVLCGGCNLNRDIAALISDSGFAFDQLDKYYIEGPKLMSFMSRGIAHAVSHS